MNFSPTTHKMEPLRMLEKLFHFLDVHVIHDRWRLKRFSQIIVDYKSHCGNNFHVRESFFRSGPAQIENGNLRVKLFVGTSFFRVFLFVRNKTVSILWKQWVLDLWFWIYDCSFMFLVLNFNFNQKCSEDFSSVLNGVLSVINF
jgi:hypothetical protein